MSTAITFTEAIWYKVWHPEFDENRRYRAIGHVSFGESAWSYLLFINERGMTYSVRVDRTYCLNNNEFSSPDPDIAEIKRPESRVKNPDTEDLDK